MKYHFSFVKAMVEDKGCILLTKEEEYRNINSKIEFICKCGENDIYVFSSYIKSKTGLCKKCNKKEHKLKNSQEYVASIFIEFGCKLLSSYEYNNLPLDFLCKCGSEGKKSFSDFKKSPFCKKCGKKNISKSNSTSIDIIKEKLKKINCTLIETHQDEKSRKRLVQYICPNKHTSHGFFDTVIKNNGRCSICRKEKNGMNHPNWRGGYDYEYIKFRKTYAFKAWRKQVFSRDEYTCQCCLRSSSELPRSTLVAHHLDGYNWCIEKRTEIENGATLCKFCHNEFHRIYGRGNNTSEQFKEFLTTKKEIAF